MFFFITAAWAFVVGGMGLMGLFMPGASKFVSLIFMAVGFVPLVLLIRHRKGRQAGFKAVHASMLAAAGVAPGTGFDHDEDQTGVAINRAARTLTLRVGEKSKTYPFADIRSWEVIKETAGQVFATGVQGSLVALGANVRARNAASAASGLFVTVKDIDNPKWRVAMGDPATQARWMEILRQSINES